MQKGQTAILILVGVLILVGIGIGVFYLIEQGSFPALTPVLRSIKTVFLTKGSEEYCRQFGPGDCPKQYCELSGPSCPICLDVGACIPKRSTQISSLVDDETANWKTYTNSQYKFSLEYPAELGDPEGSGESFLAYFYAKDYPYSLILNVAPNEKSFTNYMDELNKKRGKIYKETKLSVANRPAIQHEITDTPNVAQIETWIDVTPEMIVQIHLSSSKKDSNNSLKQLNDKILSTFKFLE